MLLSRTERSRRASRGELMENTRAMLFQCGAPKRFWAEAVNTASRNLVPDARFPKTPFELFWGTKPDVSRLRMFGGTAYVHVPQEKRKKFEDGFEMGMIVS